MLAVPGLLGSYPNAFFDVKQDQLSEFVAAISALQNEKDYADLLTKFGVRRANPEFWKFSDWIHIVYREESPVEAGIFDYSHFEKR